MNENSPDGWQGWVTNPEKKKSKVLGLLIQELNGLINTIRITIYMSCHM